MINHDNDAYTLTFFLPFFIIEVVILDVSYMIYFFGV